MVGGGAIKGKNCTVDSIAEITGGHRVTFKWTLDDGTVLTGTMDVMDGAKGDQGIQGEKGDKGDRGAVGAQGIQGVQGIQGEKGDDGYPFLIYKQYDDISEFNASDFPEIGLMFMVMTFVEDHGYPVYRYTGEGNPPYSLVVYMNTEGIKGEKGDKGDTGAQGIQGIPGNDGVGVPEGGTTGQVLSKGTNSDYDTEWVSLENTSLGGKVSDIEDVIPSTATTSNKLATANDIPDVSNFITNTVDNLVNYYTKSQTYTQTEVDALFTV